MKNFCRGLNWSWEIETLGAWKHQSSLHGKSSPTPDICRCWRVPFFFFSFPLFWWRTTTARLIGWIGEIVGRGGLTSHEKRTRETFDHTSMVIWLYRIAPLSKGQVAGSFDDVHLEEEDEYEKGRNDGVGRQRRLWMCCWLNMGPRVPKMPLWAAAINTSLPALQTYSSIATSTTAVHLSFERIKIAESPLHHSIFHRGQFPSTSPQQTLPVVCLLRRPLLDAVLLLS